MHWQDGVGLGVYRAMLYYVVFMGRERERETIIITTFIDSNLEFLQESIRSLSSVSMCHLLPPNWIMAMDHIHHFAQSQVHRAQVRLFQDNVVASLTMVEFDTPLVLGAGVGDGR